MATTKNFLYAKEPFYTPYIFTVTEEQPELPANNVLKPTRPSLPWRTKTTGAQSLKLKVNSSTKQLFVHNTNYPEIKLRKSADDGANWLPAGPNFLTYSHNSGTSPWATVFGTSSAVGTYTAAKPPYRFWPDPMEISISPSGGWGQTVDFGSNIAGTTVQLSAWLRRVPGTAAKTIRLGLYSITPFTPTATVDTVLDDDEWHLATLTATAAGSGTQQAFVLKLVTGGPFTFLVSGCQFSYSPAPYTMYQTGANGLMIPFAPALNRRKLFVDFGGTGIPSGYLIDYIIPASQTTDNGLDIYDTGVVLAVPDVVSMPGLLNFPFNLAVDKQVIEQKFANGSSEYLIVGPKQETISVNGDFVVSSQEKELFDLFLPGVGRPIMFVDNIRVPGFPKPGEGYRDPSRIWFGCLTEEPRLIYPIPEVLSTGFSIKEYI